jgi:hypothetical protein
MKIILFYIYFFFKFNVISILYNLGKTFLYNNVNVTQKKNRKYFGKLFTLASFIEYKQVLIQFNL